MPQNDRPQFRLALLHQAIAGELCVSPFSSPGFWRQVMRTASLSRLVCTSRPRTEHAYTYRAAGISSPPQLMVDDVVPSPPFGTGLWPQGFITSQHQ